VIDVFPNEQRAQVRTMFAESLVGVVSQMLVRRRGGGRVGAYEVLVGIPAVRALIREGKTHQIPSTMQVGAKQGMQTLEAAMVELVQRRVVTIEDARERLPRSEALGAVATQLSAPA
jgi:twitching motility protein PilT